MKPLALRLPTPRTALLPILALALVLTGSLPAFVSGCVSGKAPRGRPLRVGLAPSSAPVVFEQEGEIVGIEPDLARALGERLGRRVVLERVAEDALVGALDRGDVDVVMNGWSTTPERASRVLFAAPYMQSGQLALIRAADLARFGRIQTLRRPGARIGFQTGSTGERFVATELTRATSFGFDDVEAGLRSLRARRIDYFIHDAPTVWRIAGDPAQRDLHGLYQLLTDESLAWAVRRGNGALKAELDAAVAEWQRDGRIEAVIDRWIPVRVTVH